MGWFCIAIFAQPLPKLKAAPDPLREQKNENTAHAWLGKAEASAPSLDAVFRSAKYDLERPVKYPLLAHDNLQNSKQPLGSI